MNNRTRVQREESEDVIDLEQNIRITADMNECRDTAFLVRNFSIMDLFLSIAFGILHRFFLIGIFFFYFGYLSSKRYNKNYALVFFYYFSFANLMRGYYSLDVIVHSSQQLRSTHVFTIFFNGVIFSYIILMMINVKIYYFTQQLKNLTPLQLTHLRMTRT